PGQAGPAAGARNGHAVDDRLLDLGKHGERLGHLGGRDVLALPAEGVADAVDEVVVAGLVPAHQVAGAKPRVTRLEDVAEDLALGRVGACVTLAGADEARRVADPADT